MRKLFYILVLFSVLAGASIPSRAQDEQERVIPKKERRVFLWDVTISMVGATQSPGFPKGAKRSKPSFNYSQSGFPNYNKDKDIFDATRQTLINLINNIQAESTEIVVLPFRNGIVGEYKAFATAEGKASIKKWIMGWDDLKPGGTHTGTSLEKALDYFTSDRRNHVILLTDGEPSDGEGAKLMSILNNWGGDKKTKGEGNRLTYVMLTDEATNEGIKNAANNNENVFVVTPQDNIEEICNLSVSHNASIHVRVFFKDKTPDGKGTFDLSFIVEGPSLPKDYILHFYAILSYQSKSVCRR